MPRTIRRRMAKPAGTKAVINVRVMLGFGVMQPSVQLTECCGTEVVAVGRGIATVVGTLQSAKEVELQ